MSDTLTKRLQNLNLDRLYDSSGDIMPEDLYIRLQRVEQLEDIIAERREKGENIGNEDLDLQEHAHLMKSIPLLLSYKDLIAYHAYVSRRKIEIAAEQQQVSPSVNLRSVCSPSAYELLTEQSGTTR